MPIQRGAGERDAQSADRGHFGDFDVEAVSLVVRSHLRRQAQDQPEHRVRGTARGDQGSRRLDLAGQLPATTIWDTSIMNGLRVLLIGGGAGIRTLGGANLAGFSRPVLSTTQPPLRKGDCLAVEVALQAPNDNGLCGSDAASRRERGHHSGGLQSRQFREQAARVRHLADLNGSTITMACATLALLIW